jgi:hypothetical protein
METGAQQLAAYIFRGQAVPTEDTSFLQNCWDQATNLIKKYAGDTDAPAAVKTQAILLCGAELYYRRGTKSGILGDPTGLGTETLRLSLDPMQGAYQLLDKWKVKL